MSSKMIATADVCDQHGDAAACCELQFASFGARLQFQGVAVTLRGHEDNSPLRTLVTEPGHGKVIVIDGGGSLHCALLGDKNAQMAANNGWEGFVVNGAVRDVARLRGLDIGVLALGTSPRRSNKAGRCQLDAVVAFGGVLFAPGSQVFADQDGVVVLS
jgi:regulator of ribonuclease activity A